MPRFFQSLRHYLVDFLFIPFPDSDNLYHFNIFSYEPVDNAIFFLCKIKFVKTGKVYAEFIAEWFAEIRALY
jgi:hypothetical protein